MEFLQREQGDDLSHSVLKFVLVLIRILSRNRTYFPVRGTKVKGGSECVPWNVQPELIFIEVLQIFLHAWATGLQT